MVPDDDVLVVDLDDEDEPPKVGSGSAGDVLELPPVTDDMVAASAPAQPGFDLSAKCGATGQDFLVRFQETERGIWHVVDTEVVAVGKAGPVVAPGSQQVAGTFSLDRYPGCPACGSEGLVQCDHCGTAMCGGAIEPNKAKKGELVMKCPGCGSMGRLAGAVAQATGTVRGKKGKAL
jgi:hypothetical protein